MSADPDFELRPGPHWLLRRADQAAVGALVLTCLAATVAWWLAQGGWQGRLIEVERADRRTAAFQVDLNTAEWPELTEVPGIGETLAKRIVASRTTDGPFVRPDDLLRIRGIGPKTLDRVRPYLLPMDDSAAVAASR